MKVKISGQMFTLTMVGRASLSIIRRGNHSNHHLINHQLPNCISSSLTIYSLRVITKRRRWALCRAGARAVHIRLSQAQRLGTVQQGTTSGKMASMCCLPLARLSDKRWSTWVKATIPLQRHLVTKSIKSTILTARA